MSIFELSGITKVYGPRTVLNIDQLDIGSGKIYALVGPNGAGKTTLLNILGFLARPDTGRLTFRSQPVRFAESTLKALRRDVVLLDQHPIMFSTTVYRNLEFGLKIRGIGKSERTDIIREALEWVGMRAFANSAAQRLSGGETQRVALARALALSPRVFLCDEPTANVDIENQAVILEILQRIHAEKNITIIFTTHDRSQAARLAHQVLVLNHGRIMPPIYENVIAARILSMGETGIRFKLGEAILRMPVPENFKAHCPEVRMFIDPAMITVIDQQTADPPSNIVHGKVVALAAENRHVRVTTDVGIDLNVQVPDVIYQQSPLTIGQQVSVAIPAEAIQLA